MYLGYLCGAMSCYKDSLEYEEKAMAWRKELTNLLKNTQLTVFDPTKINIRSLGWYDQCIVELNMKKLKEADCIIVNVENIEKSPGSIFELTYAHCWGKPVFWFGKLNTASPHIRRILGPNRYRTLKELGDALSIVYV